MRTNTFGKGVLAIIGIFGSVLSFADNTPVVTVVTEGDDVKSITYEGNDTVYHFGQGVLVGNPRDPCEAHDQPYVNNTTESEPYFFLRITPADGKVEVLQGRFPLSHSFISESKMLNNNERGKEFAKAGIAKAFVRIKYETYNPENGFTDIAGFTGMITTLPEALVQGTWVYSRTFSESDTCSYAAPLRGLSKTTPQVAEQQSGIITTIKQLVFEYLVNGSKNVTPSEKTYKMKSTVTGVRG
ncbi:hypothetical protein DOK_16308 [gamma proteobacterium BDW918]|uniref:Pilus assembly protein n=1 Tax=Zhongshania aliphaticivorans TaxID=1470434 RepID=A0A127M9E2_9GAMM|nr:hypothetical protein [Zhongshania aliphaticivorans]AMO69862.1 hypothetical protein AZF00_16825 [Zhongshania aliphaticivorans]EIF41983.1 hypothetical protein DOK_16308 [gamma proteobacterium BDW918]